MYAQMLVGMVALTGQWWLEERKPKREEVAAHLVNLGWNGLRASGARAPHPAPRSGMDDVAEAIDAYLDEQRDVLTREPHTIYDGENVHDTRVAVRRFRTVLRVFADCFDAAAATGLDADLAWYAGLLGDVRDHQVLRDHLVGYLDTLPAEVDCDADRAQRRRRTRGSRTTGPTRAAARSCDATPRASARIRGCSRDRLRPAAGRG